MFVAQRERLLRQLAEMPHFLEQLFAALPQAAQRQPLAGEKLTLLEHLWHVLDCDRDLYHLRIARTLDEHEPQLPGVAVSGWPQARDYLAQDGATGLGLFRAERAALLTRLATLNEADFARRAYLQAGERWADLAELCEMLADHDRDHRWRMAAMAAAHTSVAQEERREPA